MLVRVFKLVFLLFYDLREQSIDCLSITLSKQYVICTVRWGNQVFSAITEKSAVLYVYWTFENVISAKVFTTKNVLSGKTTTVLVLQKYTFSLHKYTQVERNIPEKPTVCCS